MNEQAVKDLIKQAMQQMEKQHQKDSEQLNQRVCELEDHSEYLTEQLKRQQDKIQELERKIMKMSQEDLKRKQQQEIEEDWLYYCKKNLSVEQIGQKSKMGTKYAFEFNYSQWTTEERMWMDIIKQLNRNSIPQTGNDYYLEKKNLQALRQLGSASIRGQLNEEILLIVRNLPNEEKEFNQKLGIVVQLCETVSRCWEELEQMDDELMGKVVVVLESDRKIDKLSIEKDDHKILLYVEQLN